jgi:aspartate racemase
MQTIGLIGGMSWESSAQYYQIINREVKARLGGHNNAKTIMTTLNFQDIRLLQQQGNWQQAAVMLADAVHSLERAGADFAIICTNTMHKVVPDIEAMTTLPILHIADATAHSVVAAGIRRVGLLGTAFTMEQDFYTHRLQQGFGLEVIVPEAESRRVVNEVIFEELCLGTVNPQSKSQYVSIMNDLVSAGAEGIIFGCTEIMLLVGPEDSSVPVFDTTSLHALAAVERALATGAP